MVRRTENELDPADRDERLGEAIESYLELAENGTPPDPEQFADKYPDLREDLLAAIDGLELVRGLVGSSNGPGPGHGLESGRRVAGYKIVRELGRGGMGIVYEAVHVGLDRPVALKVLGASAAPDSSGRRRFLNEARTAAALHHTHIVPVFDVGQVGGLCYYAMQRIEGSGLDRVVKHLRRDRTVAAGSTYPSQKPATTSAPPAPATATAISALQKSANGSTATWGGTRPELTRSRLPGLDRAPCPPELEDEEPPFLPPRALAYYRWVASVGKQAAEALAHAHQRGVIHRDVKPSNLLVDARGMIWMADFGLARRLADPSQTQVDSLLGTPRYMSPEQSRIGPIDGRSDVYSLGATLYELLTLRAPFDGKTAAELVDQIVRLEPTPPRSFDRRIPLDLETIILKALAKRPTDRYETAQEFADDLNRFLTFEPVKARRISPLGRAWRVARRHPSLTMVSTVALIAVTAAWTTAYFRVVAERDDAVDARKDAQEAASKTLIANEQTRAALRNQSYQQATLQRLSNVANRRASGLGFLKDAATLEPDPTLTVQLRDEAMALLSLRDVVPRKTVMADRNSGLVALDDNRLGLLSDSDDGPSFRILDLTKNEPAPASQDAFDLERPRQDAGDGDRPRPRGPGRGMVSVPPSMPRPRIAALGPRVAVLWANGRGIRLFDVETGAVIGNVSHAGRYILGLHAVPNSKRLVTVELDYPNVEDLLAPLPGPGFPNRGARPIPKYRVNLWDPERADAPIATLATSRTDALSGPQSPSGAPSPPNAPYPLVSVSPEGRTIAVGWVGDDEVTLFDRDAKKIDTVDTQMSVLALALGPNDLLATSGSGVVQVWDRSAKTPRVTLTPHHSAALHLRFSPDSRALLAVGLWGGSVELWDMTTSTSTPIAVLPTSERISALTFTPTGRSLAVGQGDSVAIWSVMDPIGQVRINSTGSWMSGVEFGPGGQLVLWSHESSPRYWKPGECTFAGGQGPQLPPSTMCFNGAGQWVSIDENRILWTGAETGTVSRSIKLPDLHGEGPWKGAKLPVGRSIAHTPNGEFLAFSRGGDVLAWSKDQPDRLRRIELFDANSRPGRNGGPGGGRGGSPIFWATLQVSPTGDRLYGLTPFTRSELEFRVYELDSLITGSMAQRLLWKPGEDGKCTAMALSADGTRIALGERSGRVLILSAANGRVVDRLYPPDGDGEQPVFSLAFSRDDNTLAIGSREYVRLWSVEPHRRPKPLVRLPGHRGNVSSLAFDLDSVHLASSDDKITKVWDLKRIRQEMKKIELGW